jgi:hypothetical protein
MQVSSSELLRWTNCDDQLEENQRASDFKAAVKSAVINKRLVDLG